MSPQQLSLFDEATLNSGCFNDKAVNHARLIAHIDMDAFFASVELLQYPQLVDYPVVIGGGGSASNLSVQQRQALASKELADFKRLKDYKGRGVISTANYAARKFGLGSAMGLMKAAKLCPEAILLPSQFSLYREFSHKFKQIILQHAPVMENYGIDEVFADLSEFKLSATQAHQWALNLQQQITSETSLTCSIGLAPNKLLAKIVSEFNKPKGVYFLPAQHISRVIYPLSCKKINGIGPKTFAKLQNLQINLIGELASCSLPWLINQFGRSYGIWLYYSARGIDNSPVQTQRNYESISRETTFSQDLHIQYDKRQLSLELNKLCQQVSLDLKQKGYVGKTVAVKIKFADFKVVTRAHSVTELVFTPELILTMARLCLKKIDFYAKVRLLGVRVSNLVKINFAGLTETTTNSTDSLL